MAEEDNKPTEEQVKSANQLEEAKWKGDFQEDDLKIPYKRDTADEKEDESDDETKEEADESTKTDDEATVADTHVEPEPVVTVDDPGEYTPADYSFEVTLKDGKSVKITTPEEAEKLADDPDNFETPKQLMDFINKQNKMNRNLDRDYEKWEQQHKTFTEQIETETQRRENVENFVSEFSYLENKGLLPKIADEYVSADWSDPEVAKQPGVKEHLELLDYMVKENEVRLKAKVKPLTSIVDTFNAWQADTGRKAAEVENKKAGEDRKAAGSRVAASSPAAQGTYVPKGIAVGNPNVLKRGASDWDN